MLTSGVGGSGANTGGAGGAGISSLLFGNAPGNAGVAPGGAGSGAINSAGGASQVGGIGGAGRLIITYTCPSFSLTSTTASSFCVDSGTTSTVALTGGAASLPVGNYVVTYNRSNPSATGLTANLTVSTAGTGTFTAVGLTNVGSSIITVTKLTSASCNSNITTNNTATVTISPAIVGGTVTGGTTICSGNTSGVLTLSGNVGSVVKWQFAVSPFTTWTDVSNPSTNTTYTSVALTQTTQFRAVVGGGSCSSVNSGVTTVTVSPTPSIQLDDVTTFGCVAAVAQSASINYHNPQGSPITYSIVWNSSPPNNFAPVNNAALPGLGDPIILAVPAGILAGTYTGTFTVKNASGCESSGTVITVIANPTPSIQLNNPSVSFCVDNNNFQVANINYSNPQENPTTYSIAWNALPANSFAAVNDHALPDPGDPIKFIVPQGTPAGTYTGTLTVANENGCVSSGTVITVIVNPEPAIVLDNASFSICSNNDASQNLDLTYTFLTGNPTTYSIIWDSSPTNSFENATNEAFTGNGIVSEIKVPQGTPAGTYTGTLTVKNAGGCVSTGQVITVIVSPVPSIQLENPSNSFCISNDYQVASINYSAPQGSPTTYSIAWDASPANSFAAVNDQTLPDAGDPIKFIVPEGTPAGTYTGTLTVKNASGCVSSGQVITVIVNPTPSIELANSSVSICLSDEPSIKVDYYYTQIDGGAIYYSLVWDSFPPNNFDNVTGEGLPLNNSTPIDLIIPINPTCPGCTKTSPGTYTATLKVGNESGCESSGTVITLIINPQPSIQLDNPSLSFCQDDINSQVASINYSAPQGSPTTYSIAWDSSPANSFSAVSNEALPSPGDPIKFIVPEETPAGTYTGTLTVKNAEGCISSGTVITVIVNPTPDIQVNSPFISVCEDTNYQVANINYSVLANPTTYSIVWDSSPANSFAAINDAAMPDPGDPIKVIVPGGTSAGTYTKFNANKNEVTEQK